MPGGISSVCLAQARSLLVATFWPPMCNYIRQCCCFIFSNTAVVLAVEESSAVESLSVMKELVLTLTAKAIDTSDCCYTLLTLGWRVTVVVLSFVRTTLQRAVLTSSRQLRYEQAKYVDGLQYDGWILLKCFRSRVMAGSPCRPSRRFSENKTPIVD